MQSMGPKIAKDEKMEKNPKFCTIDFWSFTGSNRWLEHSIPHIEVKKSLKTTICRPKSLGTKRIEPF